MTDRRIVKPKPGFAMTDEYGRVVPEDGAIVRWNSWWTRRLKEGGITAELHVEEKPPTRKRKKKSDATETPHVNQSTEDTDK